ncbi:MAG: response regulator [Lachnospiraceae bacterium]|nr:response regulator [Lachnospiraceae bacterium]
MKRIESPRQLFQQRLTSVIIAFGMVMIAFGLLLYVQMNTLLGNFEEKMVANRSSDAANLYSRMLHAELDKLDQIAHIMENSHSKDEQEDLKMIESVIERNYSNQQNVFVGLMSADCQPIYGEALSPSDYTGILISLRGTGSISYTPSGGILFSCPILHDENVRYVLYELCSLSNFEERFPLPADEDFDKTMVMTRGSEIIIHFADVDERDRGFYDSRSVRHILMGLIRKMDLQSVISSLERTVKGDMYFFAAEVHGTDFVLTGMITRESISDGLIAVPRLVLTVFFLLVIMVMSLAFFLMIATQRAKESQELHRAKAEAEEASRAKSDFLANMSHEIRTPINTMLGMDELILRESRDPTLRKYATNIQNAGKNLLSLINDILDFSKIEAGKMELYPNEYDLSLVIMDMVNMMRDRAVKKGLSFELEIDQGIPKRLYGDNVRIRQVIVNLLTNAIKYTKEGSTTLAMSYKKVNEEEILLHVAVRDTGIGIKPEDLERLFSAFDRVDEVRNRTIEGTGLGLNIVHRLLFLMGSEPKVESEYGKGSVFSFTVRQRVMNWEPIGDFEAAFSEAVDMEDVYRPSFEAPEARILLVDDTELNLMVVKGLLKNTKVMIDTAVDGRQGLSMTEEKEYDVLLLDHRMPVMDGVEMFKELRDMPGNPNAHKPCIALTANAVMGAREEYLEIGFDDYLVKPVDGQNLEQMLLKFLPAEKINLEIDKQELASVEQQDAVDRQGGGDILDVFEEKDFLDVQEGIGYSGSREGYMALLKFFVNTIDDKSDEIRQYYNHEDWENFRTKVHGLKSSARVIGAVELSNRARALELACNDNDLTYIREHVGDVLAFYGSYKEKLKGIG